MASVRESGASTVVVDRSMVGTLELVGEDPALTCGRVACVGAVEVASFEPHPTTSVANEVSSATSGATLISKSF